MAQEGADLELLATLDYLYRQLRAGGGDGPWKERVVARFEEVKGYKFNFDEVSAAYDTLAKTNIIDP